MVPLNTNRKILMWFLIFPREKNTPSLIAFGQYTFAVLCFIVTTTCFFASVIFVNRHIHTDLDSSLFGVLQVSALFSAVFMQVCAHIFRPKIIAMIECFTLFYKSRRFLFQLRIRLNKKHQTIILTDDNNKEMLKFLLKANHRSELVTIFYFKYLIKIYSIGSFIMLICSVGLCFIKHHELKSEFLNTSYQITYVFLFYLLPIFYYFTK